MASLPPYSPSPSRSPPYSPANAMDAAIGDEDERNPFSQPSFDLFTQVPQETVLTYIPSWYQLLVDSNSMKTAPSAIRDLEVHRVSHHQQEESEFLLVEVFNNRSELELHIAVQRGSRRGLGADDRLSILCKEDVGRYIAVHLIQSLRWNLPDSPLPPPLHEIIMILCLTSSAFPTYDATRHNSCHYTAVARGALFFYRHPKRPRTRYEKVETDTLQMVEDAYMICITFYERSRELVPPSPE